MKFLFLKAKYQLKMFFVDELKTTVNSIKDILKPDKHLDKWYKLTNLATVAFNSDLEIAADYVKNAIFIQQTMKNKFSIDFIHEKYVIRKYLMHHLWCNQKLNEVSLEQKLGLQLIYEKLVQTDSNLALISFLGLKTLYGELSTKDIMEFIANHNESFDHSNF